MGSDARGHNGLGLVVVVTSVVALARHAWDTGEEWGVYEFALKILEREEDTHAKSPGTERRFREHFRPAHEDFCKT